MLPVSIHLADWRYIDMLDSFLGLDLGINARRCSSYSKEQSADCTVF